MQLVVESMRQTGRGTLFEEFLKLKARLEAQRLFESACNRDVPLMPKAIDIVNSLGAAAPHVMAALQRRAPHVPVVIYPTSVHGAQAAAESMDALFRAYQRKEVDVLLLVRGGGAMKDLCAFNDASLARTLVASPVPVICCVGHVTDFTIVDFCADLLTPTPTAAAELCAQPQAVWQNLLDAMASRLDNATERRVQTSNQRLDMAASRFGRPSHVVTRQQARLALHR